MNPPSPCLYNLSRWTPLWVPRERHNGLTCEKDVDPSDDQAVVSLYIFPLNTRMTIGWLGITKDFDFSVVGNAEKHSAFSCVQDIKC